MEICGSILSEMPSGPAGGLCIGLATSAERWKGGEEKEKEKNHACARAP